MSRFRLMDLLMTFGIALLMLALTVSARRAVRDAEARAGCAANLQRLAQGLVQYGLAHGNVFPRTRYEPGAPLTQYTGVSSANPFGPNGPTANDVTAPSFLIAREMGMEPRAFVCPGALENGLAEPDTFDAKTLAQRSNFKARVNYNYALANMYPDAAAVQAGYTLDNFVRTRPADFAVAGDTNPGGESLKILTERQTRLETRMTNSPNHQRDGQNILFADGSVRFAAEPFVGTGGDNVYASIATFPNPGGSNDSVLLPLWSDGPQITPASVVLRRWVLGGSMVLITLLMGYVIYRNRRRGPAPASTVA